MYSVSLIFHSVDIIEAGRFMAKNTTPRGRGRPKNPNRRELVKCCKYPHGCSKRPAPNQVYCSKEHSPYGGFGNGKGWQYGALFEIVSQEDEIEK